MACIGDNPVDGVVQRNGPVQCQVVTEALAALPKAADKAKADAKPAAAGP